MNNIAPHLKSEYERTLSLVKNDNLFTSNSLISHSDVLRAHFLIADYFEQIDNESVLQGIKSINLLGSALGRQITSFGGKKKWIEPLAICATLFFGLVKNHAFHDGNKRTALLILLYNLQLLGRTVNCPKKEFETLTVRIASNELNKYSFYSKFLSKDDTDILVIADFLRRKTRKIDTEYYPVTFEEFNASLKKFNLYLADPSNVHIWVYQKTTYKRFFKEHTSTKKLIRIGFNGWKRQVRARAVKEALKAAKLTAKYGFDSKVFFKDNEPMHKLIEEFEGPLRRLKDK